MTYEEMVERAQRMRSRNRFGAVTQEELDAVPAEQTEIAVPFGEDSVRVYRIVPKAGLSDGCPMVINFHGGGFIKGRQDRDRLFCSQIAVELSCLVWDVDYSLAPEYPFPRAVEEAYAVVDYAFRHAEELGADPKRIALMGHSAGGNLAITACLKNGETQAFKPVCLIAEYSPLDLATDPTEKTRVEGDMPAEVARTYNAFYVPMDQADTPLASPITATPEMLRSFPDSLILSAAKDSLSFEDEEFAGELAAAGVTVTCKRFQNSPHGFTINREGDWKESLALICAFLRAHF